MRLLRLSLLLALLTNTSFLFAADADWPQWRGPGRDDISTETGLLKAWPAGGPTLAWKATGVGGGFSSVAVVGDRIYTMGDGNEQSAVLCLDAKDGKTLWSTKVGSIGGGGGYPGTRCTPAVSDGLVVALGQFGDIVCVKADDGKEVWRKNMDKDFGGKMMSGWGYAESPLIDGDRVILTPGGPKGTMLALKKTTGELLWRSADYKDNAAYASAVPAKIGGIEQYLQLTGDSVAGIAALDGKLLWRAERKGATAVIPTPIYHDGIVYVTSGYNIGCNAFKISATDGTFKTEEVYANKDMINHHGGVVLVGDYLYGFSDKGGWRCMEFKTGKVLWSNPGVGKGSVSFADGHLYCRSEGGPGTVALVEATPEAYKETGRFDPPDRSKKNSWAHPVIAGGKLYLRDQDVLLCYSIKAK